MQRTRPPASPEVSQAAAPEYRGPIFVVGSPRSGTSILTWCLGQHANILPIEESVWMGGFAFDVGACYELGCRRGSRSQLSSMGVTQEEFFATFGVEIHRLILRHRGTLKECCDSIGERYPEQVNPAFNIARSSSDSKMRWVDGTPEYALHIAGLRKLFPDARFVHVVREVGEVMASMLQFGKVHGHDLVSNAQEACAYWLRTVRACVLAEEALGPHVVHRLRYAELIDSPERSLREVLQFLGEPWQAACIEPLGTRINSSHVPDNFEFDDAQIDPDLFAQALQLNAQLRQPRSFDRSASPRAFLQLEAAFDEQVKFVGQLTTQYPAVQKVVDVLQKTVNERTSWAQQLDRQLVAKDKLVRQLRRAQNGLRIFLVVQFAVAFAVFVLRTIAESPPQGFGTMLWLGFSLVGLCASLWTQREGLRRLAAKIAVRVAHPRD